MSESSKQAKIVPVNLEKHPNAEFLSIVKIDGFQVVVRTEDWIGKTTGCYCEPETICPVNRPEFSFLKREGRDKEVIKAKRLRGEWSVGLLVPTPDGFNVGDDCWDYLGLEHYEPEEEVKLLAGDCATAPPYWANLPKYDLENFRKYKYLLKDDDIITISEKINGCFKNDTKILMFDGTEKNIDNINIGDKVKSFNLNTKSFEIDTVDAKINSGKSEMITWIELEFDNGKSVICTSNHKFLTTSGWVEARFLTEKDVLL